ncbi:hypothetical protein T459_23606 [Capsicum annuum]|uniref:Uncharacterized protein n=1 Tax=Capsicum annuum TaxID=4072 RepID=A0A2G2YT63_CAPAN|nr:hypothetical protein T459_23606 [Capsicum annuum]
MTLEGEYRHIPGYWEWTEDSKGILYEKVVFEAKKLTRLDARKVSEWITFWHKKPSKYDPAPSTKEKKSARPELTYIPSRGFPDTLRWSHAEEKVFSKLGVNRDKRDDTYLTTFLSCNFFGSDYQTSWKKTHGDFVDHHLQTLVNIARLTTAIHLDNFDEVPIKEALIADVSPSLNAMLPN